MTIMFAAYTNHSYIVLEVTSARTDIRLNNCKLKLPTHVKYLGIFIDEVFS